MSDSFTRRRLFTAVGSAWERGEPLSKRPADGDRFVGRLLGAGNPCRAGCVESALFAAVRAGEIREVPIGRNPIRYGLRLADRRPNGGKKPAEVQAEVGGTSAAASAKRYRRQVKPLQSLAKSVTEVVGGSSAGSCGSCLASL